MVLRADVWREHLLEKERVLSANISQLEIELEDEGLEEQEKKNLTEQKEKHEVELKETFNKLEEIESDKAESK